MDATVKEVLKFVRENDVKFIRLAFCDLLGTQKNISIMPSQLEYAFTQGISFDASAITGFGNERQSDLFLFPEAATLCVLPWRPQQGRVVRFYCDIKYPDGRAFACDTRAILKRVIEQYTQKKLVCKIGAECEFYLFTTDELGNPTQTPFDQAGYFDVAPLDKGENVRREICLCLEEMGIEPEASHHEQGPGQNEIDFRFSDALASADNLITFKAVVKAIAARNGLFASFMPKPVVDKSGNGMHINLSIAQNTCNLFENETHTLCDLAQHFLAGILAHICEITLFLNATTNSYARLGAFEAPKYVSWSHQNRSQLVRIPAANGERTRLELRSADAATNPYLAFALVIAAGLDGIEKEMLLPDAVDENLLESVNCKLEMLPQSLEQALETAKKSSAFARSVLGDMAFEQFCAAKAREVKAMQQAASRASFETAEYFSKL